MSFPTGKSDRYVVEGVAPKPQILLSGLNWEDSGSQDHRGGEEIAGCHMSVIVTAPQDPNSSPS